MFGIVTRLQTGGPGFVFRQRQDFLSSTKRPTLLRDPRSPLGVHSRRYSG